MWENQINLQVMWIHPSALSTKTLQLGHFFHLFSLANNLNFLFSLSLLSNLLNSLHSIPWCQGTLHSAQNNLWHLGHSVSVITTPPSSITRTSEHLSYGQWIFSEARMVDSMIASSHLSNASCGRTDLRDSGSIILLHSWSGQVMWTMFCWSL